MLSWLGRRLRRQIVAASIVQGLIIVIALVALLAAIDSQQDAADRAERGALAVAAAEDLEKTAIDIETGQRGFVITGEAAFLEPTKDALDRYPEIGEELIALTAGLPQASLAEGAVDRIDDYAEFANRLIDVRMQSFERAREIVLTGEGKRRVDSIRRVVGLIRAREAEEQALARADADRLSQRATAIAIAAIPVALGVLALFTLLIRRRVIDPATELAATAGRIAAGERSARIDEAHSADEIGEMGRAFNQMAASIEAAEQEARSAEAARDEFFALVSHELRTPLTSIVGYIALLDEDLRGETELSDEERAKFLAIVDRNSRRLLRLVGDLLFVARLDAGKLDLESARFELAGPVAEAIEAARPRAAAGAVSLRADLGEPIEVTGDPGRLGQAVDNLLSNAIKYTPEGGSVEVRLSRRDDFAVIEVADTGVGIPEAELEQLFGRYFRASTGSKVEGIGLGLVITRAIVEGHGGRLTVASAEGSGSTFAIELPVEPIAGI